MTEFRLTFPSVDRFTVEVDTAALDGVATDSRSYGQRFDPPPKLRRSVRNLAAVLGGEETTLLTFAGWTKRLEVRPDEGDNVTVAIVGTDDEPEIEFTSTRARVCRAVLDGARSYLDCFGDAEAIDDGCFNAELSALVTDRQRRLDHYEAHGTQQGYEPTVEEWQVEAFVRDCITSEYLGEQVRRTGALEPFVRSLTEREDDTFVSECYRNLLEFDHEFRRPTVQVLAEHPDERASDPLITALWAYVEYQDTVVRALGQVPSQRVLEEVGMLLDDYGTNRVERDVLLAALEVVRDVDVDSYLGVTAVEELTASIAEIASTAVDDEIVDCAETALASLDQN